ncbi:hypothetical protein FJZ36_12945 [Candidatus Poribacteria bacterium]|nr:hypothetical protein [Candidatus Poribacteria bacterium]
MSRLAVRRLARVAAVVFGAALVAVCQALSTRPSLSPRAADVSSAMPGISPRPMAAARSAGMRAPRVTIGDVEIPDAPRRAVVTTDVSDFGSLEPPAMGPPIWSRSRPDFDGVRAEPDARELASYTMRRQPAPAARYEPPEPAGSATEYLLSDIRLTDAQRRVLREAIRRYEAADASLRGRLLAVVSRYSKAPPTTAPDAAQWREMLGELRAILEDQHRLVLHARQDFRARLTPLQWQRFDNWMRSRPWMPFHRMSELAAPGGESSTEEIR